MGVEWNDLLGDLPLCTDFCDAFSSVHRGHLFALLRSWGIPERHITYLERLHSQQRLFVRVNGVVHAAAIAPTTGVLQGDTLAPYLFIIVMDQILRRVRYADGVLVDKNSGVRLPLLAYADDVVLLSNTFQGVTESLRRF